jgi:hypothetical protein
VKEIVKRKRIVLDWTVMDQVLNNIDRNQGNGKAEMRRQEVRRYVGG